MSLLYDRPGGEPYLALPGYPNIIITPRRAEDSEAIAMILNDISVAKWLTGPPFPYTLKDAVDYFNMNHNTPTRILSEEGSGTSSNANTSTNKFLERCPVNTIRKVNPETGEETFIGSLELCRHIFLEIEDEEERKRAVIANEAKAPGDESLVWSVGNFLDPCYQGRGITTAVARTMIEWGKSNLNMQDVRVCILEGNIGSRRVYEKIGFVHLATMKDAIDIVATKGGGKTSVDILEWKKL